MASHESSPVIRSGGERGGAVDRPSNVALRFVSLEITPQCNLTCGHCYTKSSPYFHDPNVVDWLRILREAHELGCRQVQFIGGEPTIYPKIVELLTTASDLGYEYIEIYTNLVSVPNNLLRTIGDLGVKVATSFYSSNRDVHEQLTGVKGSFDKTVAGIRQVLLKNIPLRVGLISIHDDEYQLQDTISFLSGLGVDKNNVGVDHLRPVGRGIGYVATENPKERLCGNCWKGRLAISWDGICYPCVFSRNVPVGDVLKGSLEEIVWARALQKFREEIFCDSLVKKHSFQETSSSSDFTRSLAEIVFSE